MAKSSGGKPPVKNDSDGRQNGKTNKRRPKVWDATKRRLVTKI